MKSSLKSVELSSQFKLALRFFILFTAFIPLSIQANSFFITDDSGQTLELDKPAKRIISLAPHITELLFHIEQGKKVVGVDNASDFPLEAKEIKTIGNANQINLESILALKPDLVIAWYSGNTNKQIHRLKEFDVPVYYSEPRHLNDISKTMQQFGKLTGSVKIANKKSEEFTNKIDDFKNIEAHNGGKKLKVFYQVWSRPLMTLNGEHIVSEIIRLCGGENIFSNLPILAPQVSFEAVIQANPDLIISGDQNINELEVWKQWETISAVSNRNFLSVNSNHLVRAGPRIIKGAETICSKISQLRNGN